MWLTGGSIGLTDGVLSIGGEFTMLVVGTASPAYECGDSRESTGDMVTELSERPPAALVTLPLAPTTATTFGPSPPAGFFRLFAFISFRSLAVPAATVFAFPPARRFFLPCGPGRMPIWNPVPFVPQTMEECPPQLPMWLGPECGLCTRLYWSSRRTMSWCIRSCAVSRGRRSRWSVISRFE